jgi:hypothetical protein
MGLGCALSFYDPISPVQFTSSLALLLKENGTLASPLGEGSGVR